MTDETQGAHIYAITDTYLYISNTLLIAGLAKMGGAMFLEGNTTV